MVRAFDRVHPEVQSLVSASSRDHGTRLTIPMQIRTHRRSRDGLQCDECRRIHLRVRYYLVIQPLRT